MEDSAAVCRGAHGAPHGRVQSMKENEKLHGDGGREHAVVSRMGMGGGIKGQHSTAQPYVLRRFRQLIVSVLRGMRFWPNY
jgi:hypothetical protein